MRPVPILTLILSQIILLLSGCVTADKQMSPSDAALPTRPIFNHKMARDSVDWASLNPSGEVPNVTETALEWPGEQLGLIGPIVATGSKGSDKFIIVFDPAGIPVGMLTRKAYKKDPARLAVLLAKAQVRSEIQNLSTLNYLINQRKGANGQKPAAP